MIAMNGKLKPHFLKTALLAMAIASLPMTASAQMSGSSGGPVSSGPGGPSSGYGGPAGGMSGAPGGYGGPSGGMSGAPGGYGGPSGGMSGAPGGYGAPGAGYAAPAGGVSGAPNMGMPGAVGYGPPGSGAMPGNNPGMAPGTSSANTQFAPPGAGAGSGNNGSVSSILNGTGVSPDQAAQMMNTVTAGCQSGLANQMGMSCDQIQQIRSQIANGGSLNSSQLESISTRLAAKGMSPSDIASVAGSLGLTNNQMTMVRGRMGQLQSQGGQGGGQSTSSSMMGQQPGTLQMQQMTGDTTSMSSIERSFHQSVTGQVEEYATPENLYQYGYSMFSGQVSTFAPVGNVPVGADYIIGPGDELRVLVWGRVNDSWSLEVQRSGEVELPQRMDAIRPTVLSR
jgi:hypothetical protein